jgi:hypothetical protein
MTPGEINDQLEGIASDPGFAVRAAELTDSWASAGAGPETIAPVLRFIEEHPTVEFGTPRALVHFVERFFQHGYQERLVESIERKPTAQTIWMLNRVINGTKETDAKQILIAILDSARRSPLADQNTRQMADRFLARLSS